MPPEENEDLDTSGIERDKGDSTGSDTELDSEDESTDLDEEDPLAALTANNTALREENIRLTERINAATAIPGPTKATKEKVYTRIELAKLVEDGQITEVQADTVMDNQLRAEVRTEISEQTARGIKNSAIAVNVHTGLAEYKKYLPDLNTPGSENRTKVTAEYSRLVNDFDMPPSEATELIALEKVFGPVSLLKPRKSGRQTHQETGGSSSSGTGKGKKGGSLFDKLSTDRKQYYNSKIASGLYKDEKAVEEELKFARA